MQILANIKSQNKKIILLRVLDIIDEKTFNI